MKMVWGSQRQQRIGFGIDEQVSEIGERNDRQSQNV